MEKSPFEGRCRRQRDDGVGCSRRLGASGLQTRFKNTAFKTLEHYFSTSAAVDSRFRGNDKRRLVLILK
jgi:hypothetical protein